MVQLLIGVGAGIATFIGGIFALQLKDKINLILGFSAGAVIGVALLDLLPETLELGQHYYALSTITLMVATGFMAYMLLDRVLLITTTKESGHRGHVGAGSLTVHSLLDGLGIGFAFQLSATLGAVVAIAVLVHDFSDGINTVNLSLFGTGKPSAARGWLIADALAPIVGIIATFFIRMQEREFTIILALFAGFFLYIGASELLPESHHRSPRLWTSILTILGAGLIWTAIHFAAF